MGWVYLDDQFPDHPKIVAAGPLAAWLYVAGLAYCKRYGTPGTIPKAQVPRLIDHRTAREQARKLVASGLWIDADSIYRVHDWDQWNRDPNARSEAGRKAAQARWSRASRNANASESHSESHQSGTAVASLAPMRSDAHSRPLPNSRSTRGLTGSDPTSGTRAAARVRAETNGAAIRSMLADPAPAAETIAQGLAAARRAARQRYDADCPTCDGHGWTYREGTDDADPCPACNPPVQLHAVRSPERAIHE